MYRAHLLFLPFLACISIASTFSETPLPRQLPQAQPGSFYSAQLAIPPGLGYPFQECKLTGDTLPKTLRFDCQRLQFKGRIPAAEEKTYNITLLISDARGNTQSFILSLLVSSKPALVDLSGPSQPGDPASSAPMVVASKGGFGGGPVQPPNAKNASEVRSSEGAQELAGTDPSLPAAQLGAAAAQLQPVSYFSRQGSTVQHASIAKMTRSRSLHAFSHLSPACAPVSAGTKIPDQTRCPGQIKSSE